jgi:hypothetical protein
MTNVDRVTALLEAVGPNAVAELSPAERQRLADGCRRVLALAEPKPAPPKTGVLADLRNAKGSQ